MERTYEVRGMHCAGCVARIERAARGAAGVRTARVERGPDRVTVEVENGAAGSLGAALARAVAAAGDYTLGAEVTTPPHSSAEAGRAAAGSAETGSAAGEAGGEARPSLYPLGLIVGFIVGVAALATFTRGDGSWRTLMNDFMGGFFVVFAFFKLLDLRGFVAAYRMYDVVAGRVAAWAWVYPFVELALGAAYLARVEPVATNVATLVLMLVGSVGVLRALVRKSRIRCACLGTALNLPMTTVTLVEDVGMAAMAGAMLVWGHG